MSICFITEIDISGKLGGAITSDLKNISCLRKLSTVDLIYLQTNRYKSVWLAFPVFILQILGSFSKSYHAYFSRGLFASFSLILLQPFHRRRVVHNTLSVPLASVEARYSKRNKLFAFIWYSLMRFLEKVVPMKADITVVADYNYASALLKMGVEEHRVQVVPFYVEDEFFLTPIRQRPKEPFIFCYVGGFHPYHEIIPVIEAFERLSKASASARLHLVGDGPSRPDIEKEVWQRNLTTKVRFLGRLPHSSIPRFLSDVDAFIILINKPGISTSLLEAAAAGKAIITLKRKNDKTLERYFRHTKEIFMVNSVSLDELEEAMRLLYEDLDLRNTIALGARQVAGQHFSQKVATEQLERVLRKIG